jgi:alkylhydroperoxidase family enzyme
VVGRQTELRQDRPRRGHVLTGDRSQEAVQQGGRIGEGLPALGDLAHNHSGTEGAVAGHQGHATQQRIALAVAEHQGSEYALSTLQRTARDAGLGLDEIALAREFDSRDEREATLLRFVKALLESDGTPPRHKHEEALEAGWADEQILEAIAHVALATFANLVTRAGDVPRDGSNEESRLQQAA